MSYIHAEVLEKIDNLKKWGKFEAALKLVNSYLVDDPMNQSLLMEVADIHYRSGELEKSSKPVDFLLSQNPDDPMNLYIKWIIEMDKRNRAGAREFLKKAIKLTNLENAEVIRVYGLSEFWYGNREKGIDMLKMAFQMNQYDAEVIYNLAQLYLMQHKYNSAGRMISYYNKYHAKLQSFEKEMKYYDEKIELFNEFLLTKQQA
jgi:tetratricopeptide (TPR) repeat protein